MAVSPSERQQAIAAWLEANGINPGHVPQDADMTISEGTAGSFLCCDVFDLTSDGRKQVDETGKNVATTCVAVPLQVEPPEWWEPRVKPTRDELLDVIAKLRQLGPALEYEATAPGMHDAAREAKRDASRRIRALLPDGP
jgi:hypothetical protein